MSTKKVLKIVSFLLLFAFGFLTIQSCSDSKAKKADTEQLTVEADSNSASATESDSKCGDGKCGEDKKVTDSTSTKEGKCGDDKKATDSTKKGKCGDGKSE